jgi:UDP:flavonoid glycosyltransferase YjiC (YdhE family)
MPTDAKRITVAALGTRGDVQPLLALCLGLRAAGHAVTVVAGSNFAPWIARYDLPLVPAVDIQAIMTSERGLAWSESSRNPLQELRMMRSLFDEHAEAMAAPLMAAAAGAGLLLSGFTSEPLVQAISASTRVPYVNTYLQPSLPTRSGAASLAPLVPYGESLLNRWMGQVTDRLLWSVAARPANRLRARLGLPAHTARSYARARRAAPVLYAFSPHVVPPPADWPAHAAVTGYWFLDEADAWQPPADLVAFLQAGPPPVYIGFGSMSNSAPGKTLALILDAVRQSGQRAVVAAGWGRVQADSLPDNVLGVSDVPHAWLFPRVAAVVHHGGAGTTAAGLRAGRPALIVPHMSDQPFWGRRLHALGVALPPVPRHALTARRLAAGLRQLVNDPELQSRAAALGEKLRAERGVQQALAALARFGVL